MTLVKFAVFVNYCEANFRVLISNYLVYMYYNFGSIQVQCQRIPVFLKNISISCAVGCQFLNLTLARTFSKFETQAQLCCYSPFVCISKSNNIHEKISPFLLGKRSGVFSLHSAEER